MCALTYLRVCAIYTHLIGQFIDESDRGNVEGKI